MWDSCQRCEEPLHDDLQIRRSLFNRWDVCLGAVWSVPRFLCVYQEKASLSSQLSLDWEEEMATAQPHDCVAVASNHPLYVLYTSGTTGTPKVRQQSHMEITADLTRLHTEQLHVPVEQKHHRHDINKMGPSHSTAGGTACKTLFQIV